ncbi:MAG: guanylate kinase [Pseudomonadota bacterium]|nr:guanylate kinase [Pseudomonadota bacterium]MEC7961349.1 guanylate kinase [Pseudomonadota bacterium]MEC8020251.1 guanylate kinase [Pseudomonadota bacterium]MEC8498309.1 guanylate kinase [Pseudomonadota bacterium]|tara:strand:+ start:432 stop:1076 length:645 start_codon:yes stop_codon:yes gene_type:complete
MKDNLNKIRRGMMIVLSSPSGAGKTSLSRKLLEKNKNLFLSISFTTRPPRPLEVNESDYFFVDDKKFIDMLNKDEFLEHAKVFDFYYGTPKKPVMNALKSGKDILFDIDWQGTQQLMNSVQDDLVKIFVLPPSAKELEKRLLKRNQDTDETVKSRMSKASDEISHYAEYDYIIINEDFDESLEKINSILIAEGLKRTRQNKIQDVIKSLRDDLF